MKLSSPTRYAIRILFELSAAPGPLTIGLISEKTGISLRTVENIHTVLRQHGLTRSTVGAKGGVELSLPLAAISLGKIVLLFDDGVEFSVCCGDKSNDCPHQHMCETRAVWRTISGFIQKELDQVSLQTVLQQSPQLIDKITALPETPEMPEV